MVTPLESWMGSSWISMDVESALLLILVADDLIVWVAFMAACCRVVGGGVTPKAKEYSQKTRSHASKEKMNTIPIFQCI